MACIQCNPEFVPSNLIIEIAQICDKCQNVMQLIRNYAKKSHGLYHLDLQKKFKLIAPIFTGNELIVENPKFIDDGYNEDEIISETTIYLNLNNSTYKDKQSIMTVSSQIMGQLIDLINNLISDNPKGYLIAFLNLLEYNVHLTMITIGWINDRDNKINIEEITDSFGRIIIKSLKFQKDYNFMGQFEGMYKEWESVLSYDKLAFQYGIEILAYLVNKKPSVHGELDPIKFGKLISTIRAVYKVLHSRDSADEDQELIIDKFGNILGEEILDHAERSKEYVEAMVGRRVSSLGETAMNEFNIVCRKHIGISLDDIYKFLNRLREFYLNSDDFIIGSIDYLQKLIKLLLQCSDKESEMFLSFILSSKKDNFSFATSTTLRINRPLRKCLIPIEDDIIACPISVLEFSLIGLYMDIIEGTLPDSLFQKELFKIVNTFVHERFENEVILHLQNSFPDAIVKGDIKEKTIYDIVTGKGFVQFSGQIDVLMLLRNKVFILECKDPGLKFTTKAISNEVHKFTKLSRGSYQTKLNSKVDEIYNNWDSVLNYFGVLEISKIDKHKPIALFVTDTFSVASLEKDLPNPVVPFTKIIQWINERV